ncbi:hypothetical protein FKM82_004906 [Ascaphus truei]
MYSVLGLQPIAKQTPIPNVFKIIVQLQAKKLWPQQMEQDLKLLHWFHFYCYTDQMIAFTPTLSFLHSSTNLMFADSVGIILLPTYS